MTTVIERDVDTSRGLLERDSALGLGELVGAGADADGGTSLDLVWALLRFGLGWIFLWAFLDKVFGLGFATEAGSGWIDGGSPRVGFLKFGATGPLADYYGGLAGYAVVDWMFMLGILGIGLPLVLGIGVRIAASVGVVMLLLMYLALLVPEHNPFMDDHIIYIAIMLGLAIGNPGYRFGLGRWWGKSRLATRYPILK